MEMVSSSTSRELFGGFEYVVAASRLVYWCLTMIQAVQKPGVYSAAYGTVHCKERLTSFEIRVAYGIVRLRAFFCRDIAMIVREAT